MLREGSVPTIEMQVLVPIQEHNEFDNNIVDIALLLQQIPEYVSMSQAAYGQEPNPFVITRAIANFERVGHGEYFIDSGIRAASNAGVVNGYIAAAVLNQDTRPASVVDRAAKHVD